jgi:8-hydroxy-5-deazaflavin:NADPH oxidoreductase
MPALGVLGTGAVGQAIATRAAEVGYDVTVGARSSDSDNLAPFSGRERITPGSFADAAAAAQLVVNATNGNVSLDALQAAGADNLQGKVILDLANELRFVDGSPVPQAAPDNSLVVRLQQAFPKSYLVKALNTMTNQVMVHPERVPGDHVVFLAGDSDAAKEAVRQLLRAFGWREAQMLDLGGLDTAVATEMMMAIWLRVLGARGWDAPPFNWAINSAE